MIACILLVYIIDLCYRSYRGTCKFPDYCIYIKLIQDWKKSKLYIYISVIFSCHYVVARRIVTINADCKHDTISVKNVKISLK